MSKSSPKDWVPPVLLFIGLMVALAYIFGR